MTQLIPIRSQVVAPEDYYLLSVDLSSAEAWVVAYLADEPRMKKALAGNIMHETSACVLFEMDIIESKDEYKGTKDQRYLGKKYNHACVDGETEVLTKTGWVQIKDLQKNVEVAQWNISDRSIEFVKPLEYIKKYHKGNMYHWLGAAYSQMVTPDHKMVLNTNKKLRPIIAEDLYKNFKSGKLPYSGYYKGEVKLRKTLVQLLVAIQADATRASHKCVFHLKKQRKVVRLIKLLTELNIEYSKTLDSDNAIYIRFNFPQELASYLSPNFKDFTWELLKLDADMLDVILEELEHWDGNGNRYFSKNYKNVELIQTICHLRGKAGKLQNSQNCWTVSKNKRQNADISSMRKFTIPWNDYVYCLTVYSGYFLVRRLGHISVTGNCNYRMGYIRAAEVINKESDKPPYVTVTTKQSQIYHKRWNEFYRLKPWWMEIEDKLRLDHYLITPYGRKREFFDPLGDELYKKATAFIPQSTIWDHLSGRVQKEIGMEGGLKSIYRNIILPSNGSIRITNTSHDSVILEVPKSSITDIAEQCLKYLTRPLMINGEVFTIPADAEYGERWGELEPIKA